VWTSTNPLAVHETASSSKILPHLIIIIDSSSYIYYAKASYSYTALKQTRTELTSSSAIAEGSRCRVGQCVWPKVEDDKILQTLSIFNHFDVITVQFLNLNVIL